MSGGSEDPRRAAFRVLRAVQEGAFVDRAAVREFAPLEDRDRRLARELAYGCVRLRGRLDHELEVFLDLPSSRVEPDVRVWLRLGLYQLREMRVPPHAAVNEAVEGVRETVGERATGFVNGVLRAAARREDRKSLFRPLEEDPAEHLSTWGSHPRWLVERWLERWPLGAVRRLVELNNEPPPVTLRLLAGDVKEAEARLAGTDAALEPLPDWPRCVELVRGSPRRVLARIPAVAQDPAASAVVDYMESPARGGFLDACAAPGGKALALAWDAGDGPLVGGDVSVRRLRKLQEARRRLDLGLSCVAMDARRPAVGPVGSVLADVPCTGTGTFRRRPDARWNVTPEALASLQEHQREILDGLADVVSPGGLLVYATCSLEPEENEAQVRDFLDRRDDFRREKPGDDTRSGLPEDVMGEEGSLRVLPWARGTDGAYAARLRKSGG